MSEFGFTLVGGQNTRIEAIVVSPGGTEDDNSMSADCHNTTEREDMNKSKGSFDWNVNAAAPTHLLLTLRMEFDTQFENPKKKKNLIWTALANKMKKDHDYIGLTGEICKKKFDNLSITYKSRCKKSDDSGEESLRSWPFHVKMHEIVGKRASINPPAEYLGDTVECVSSPGSTSGSTVTDNIDDDSFDDESLSSSSSRGSAPKKRRYNKPEWITELKSSIESGQADMWQKYEQMEEKRSMVLQAMERERTEKIVQIEEKKLLEKIYEKLN